MKQFIRNFNKQKVVGTLNICSLSLSIMVSIVVGLWPINELTYDNFYPDGDRMYRVVQNFELNGNRSGQLLPSNRWVKLRKKNFRPLKRCAGL